MHYVYASIDLDEGIPMASDWVDCQIEDAKIGKRSQSLLSDVSEQVTQTNFKPI